MIEINYQELNNKLEYKITSEIENAHENDVNCVKYNDKGDLIASASDDCLIKIWKLQ